MKKELEPVIFLLFVFLGMNLFRFEPSFVVKHPLTYVLLLGGGLSWFLSRKTVFLVNFPHRFDSPRFLPFLICLFSFVLTITLFGPNLQAKWGVIDDHEIMSYIDKSGRLSLTEVPVQLLKTEVGSPGTSLRFRPSYYTLRLLETVAWGTNATVWYGVRLIILGLSVSITWFLLHKKLGFYLSGLFIVYLLSFSYWKDIFGRLGPGETYAVLGLAVFCLCFDRIHTWLQHNPLPTSLPKFSWVGLCLSALVCIGSKENFVLLFFPLSYLFFRTWQRKELRRSVAIWLCFGVVMGFLLFVGGATVLAIQKAGHDVYANSTASLSRTRILVQGLKLHQSKEFIVVLGLLGLGVIYLRGFFKKSQFLTLFAQTFIIEGLLWLLYLSQYVFYNGDWPNGSRYDFPGQLIPPLFFLNLFLLMAHVLQAAEVSPLILKGLKTGVVIGFCAVIVMNGFVPIQATVKENVVRTQNFTAQIERVAQVLRDHPEKTLIIESGSVWDYEPVVSYERFLRAYQVENPMMLRIHGYSFNTAQSDLERKLTRDLFLKSTQGGVGYEPLSSAAAQLSGCYSLSLSGQFTTECETLK